MASNATASTSSGRSIEAMTAEERPVQFASVRMEQPDSALGAKCPSCFQLWSKYASCLTVGKQIRSLYRYGSTRDCTRAMDDFKWCLAARQLAPDAKRDAWIDRRATWWAERRAGPSSEDVWDARSYPADLPALLMAVKPQAPDLFAKK